MIAAIRGDAGYDVLLLLHILTVIAGFGSVIFNSVVDVQAAAADHRDGLATTRATLTITSMAEKALYLVPVFGIVLILVGDGNEFSDMWISASFVVYIAAIGVLHGLIFPNHKALVTALEGAAAGNVDATAITTSRQRMRIGNGVLTGLLIVGLYLMIWQPT